MTARRSRPEVQQEAGHHQEIMPMSSEILLSWSKVIRFLVLVCSIGGTSHAAPGAPRTKKSTATLSGDEAKAVSVALAHFEKDLESGRQESKSPVLNKYMFNIWNYDVTVTRSEAGSYFVAFKRKMYPGVIIAGGGAKYEIGAEYNIIRFQFAK